MPTLLLDHRVLNRFQRRVAPLLRAKLAPVSGAAETALPDLLRDRPRAWLLPVERPTIGAVAPVTFKGRAGAALFDVETYVYDLPDYFRGDMTVRVRAGFGLMAACDRVDGSEQDRKASQPHALLAITSKEVTVLADVLPGKDALIAVEVWPNERLPLKFLVRRPNRLSELSDHEHGLEIRVVNPNQFGFAVDCLKCNVSGKVDCLKCGATGHLDCRKCGTTGRLECRSCDRNGRVDCRKCDGSGVVKPQTTCSKCGGSGDFVGRRGDVVGNCNRCYGRGYLDQLDCGPCGGSGSLSCRVCGGHGDLDCRPCSGTGQISCHPCGGSGEVDCPACDGIGRRHAQFSAVEGTYTAWDQDDFGKPCMRIIGPDAVELFDWTAGVPVRAGGAFELLKVVSATAVGLACDPAREAEVDDYRRKLAGVNGCLDKSLASQGILESRPIRVGRPEPSTERSTGGVIYEFPLLRDDRKWFQSGQLPFPARTAVQLVRGADHREPIDLTAQGGGSPLFPDQSPTLAGISGVGRGLRLRVRFPVTLDVTGLPEEFALRADCPPPSEVTQARHLARWCRRENRDHAVLQAMASPRKDPIVQPEVRLHDPGIARFPKQKEAVRLGVSDLPLSLIKGPPGTGKTTVITEIVHQLVSRGQRVLVCSQTHQAVRNVLERLHRAGGFRMLRHGRDDDFSDLERMYRAAGASDQFHSQVAERAGTTLRACTAECEHLTRALNQLSEARDAADRLSAVRTEVARETEVVQGEFGATIAAADRTLEVESARAKQEAREQSEAAETARMVADHGLTRVHQELQNAAARRDRSAAVYARRKGTRPTRIDVRQTLISRLRDRVLPSWLISNTALQQRFSLACDLLDRGKSEEQNLLRRVAAADEAQRDANERLVRQLVAANSEQKSAVLAAETRKAEQLATLGERLAGVESESRATQDAASFFAPALGNDSPASAWQEALDAASARLSELSTRRDFVADWLRDISADPQGLLGYYWDNIQVFFSTCVGLASWRRLVERGRDAVDLVIIDEAAHATAAETVVPLTYARRALLIGDERQLPPVLTRDIECDDQCSAMLRNTSEQSGRMGPVGTAEMDRCWLKCSLFEWLWRFRPELPRVMLDTQFRMHPDIADFVGSVFYPEGLTSGVAAADRDLGFGEFTRPVILIPTSAYKDRFEEAVQKGDSNTSYCNPLEARILRRVIDKAENELREPQTFGIITPYSPQVQAVRSAMESLMPNLRKVRLTRDDVASVDSFQGSERDVILVSFVRSPKPCRGCSGKDSNRAGMECENCHGRGWEGSGLKFVHDLRRLNVAFSRARKMLILVGDIDALIDPRYRGRSEGGKTLGMFRDYCANRGKVLHLWERSDEAD